MRSFWLVLIALLSWSGLGVAQTVTMKFMSNMAGITLAPNTAANVGMSLGTVTAFGGAVPAGVTKTINGSSYTLSTPIDLQVVKQGGLISASYTLTAQLQSSDLVNTWTFNGVTISTTAATITTTGVYARVVDSFSLTIPFSAPPGAISNTINFVVTSN